MGWTGVDLDGTLAYYHGWKGPEHIGDPIDAMVLKVKRQLSAGKEVRIFTARADDERSVRAIKMWLKVRAALPSSLKITNKKDFECEEIWDDRARQVIRNKGEFVGQQD